MVMPKPINGNAVGRISVIVRPRKNPSETRRKADAGIEVTHYSSGKPGLTRRKGNEPAKHKAEPNLSGL